jgi:hypothetical protein
MEHGSFIDDLAIKNDDLPIQHDDFRYLGLLEGTLKLCFSGSWGLHRCTLHISSYAGQWCSIRLVSVLIGDFNPSQSCQSLWIMISKMHIICM